MHLVNDGKFPNNSPVEVCYPRTEQQEHGDRAAGSVPPTVFPASG